MMKNPIAKELRTPKYKSRVVKSKKIYDRKKEDSRDAQRQILRTSK